MSRSTMVLAGGATAFLATCLSVSALAGADPLSAMEWIATIVLGLWAGLFGCEATHLVRLTRLVARDAMPIRIGGIDLWMSGTLGPEAFVAGFVRPRIFVGEALISSLTSDELIAVLRHEEHHRSTRAPLRATALVAWRHVAALSGLASLFDERLAQLEIAADDAAIARGSSPRTLARALVKADRTQVAFTSGFASPSDLRIQALLGRVAGAPVAAHLRLPLEWLAVAVVSLTVICHV